MIHWVEVTNKKTTIPTHSPHLTSPCIGSQMYSVCRVGTGLERCDSSSHMWVHTHLCCLTGCYQTFLTCANCCSKLQWAWQGLQRYFPPPFVSSNLVTHSGISREEELVPDVLLAALALLLAFFWGFCGLPLVFLIDADPIDTWSVTPTVKMIDNQNRGSDQSVFFPAKQQPDRLSCLIIQSHQ